jgi:hypothetical protein
MLERPQRGAEAVLLSLTFNRLDVGEIRRKESIPSPPIRSYVREIGASARASPAS